MQESNATTHRRTMWITWEDDGSIRSRVLARELGADFRSFANFTRSRRFRLLRYPVAILRSLWAIVRSRPAVLIVQNPSIVLAFQASLLRAVMGFRLVIDLHTVYVAPAGASGAVAAALSRFALRHCDAVVVTNETYRERVSRLTERPIFVLPDKVPALECEIREMPLRGRRNVLYICTFSPDEPWAEVISAAESLEEDVVVYVSGRSRSLPPALPVNVELTGYLPDADYQNMIRSVDAVIVLTTAEDCLVCGGYEAVSAGKPLVLSDTRALREFFSKGTVFTANRRESIAKAIGEALARAPELRAGITAQRDEMHVAWERRWSDLRKGIGI